VAAHLGLEGLLRRHLAVDAIELHLVDGGGGDTDANHHRALLAGTMQPGDRLFPQFRRPRRRQPSHRGPSMLKV
jgi:hypothetical protein